MVKLLNIVWNEDIVRATILEEGYMEPTYDIVYDLKNHELLENGCGKMNSFIFHAINGLEELYEKGDFRKEYAVYWY